MCLMTHPFNAKMAYFYHPKVIFCGNGSQKVLWSKEVLKSVEKIDRLEFLPKVSTKANASHPNYVPAIYNQTDRALRRLCPQNTH